ncbi:hypothetical protein JCM10212_006248 [Sporobolomyces blumeae]
MVAAAEQSKAAGNAAFKAADWPLALSHYSTAISLDPSVSTYPLNRSLVHLRLGNYKDALRDATRALDLDGGVNVKAMFRKALAERGLGRLDDAKRDLQEAKKQGGGADVDAELAAVEAELQKKLDSPKQAKESGRSPAQDTKSSAEPAQRPTSASTPQSKTDRLRAAIASGASTATAPAPPTSSSAIPSLSKPIPSNASASSDDGFMRAVSSRKLTPQPPKAEPSSASPASPSSPQSTSRISELPESSTSAAPSFAAKKASRQARQAPLFPSSSSSSSSSPTPVSRDPPSTTVAPPLSSTTVPPPLAPSLASFPPAPSRPPRPSHPSSSTFTSIESYLHSTDPSDPARTQLLRSIDPDGIERFVGDALNPDLLSAILAQLDRALTPPSSSSSSSNTSVPPSLTGPNEDAQRDTRWISDLVEGLTRCKRFETACMFLDDKEKEIVRRIVEMEEQRVKDVRHKWQV